LSDAQKPLSGSKDLAELSCSWGNILPLPESLRMKRPVKLARSSKVVMQQFFMAIRDQMV
jgi:hypothetical protein